MIETRRLLLRPWREADKAAFVALVNTPAMMAHFGGVRPDCELHALIDDQMTAQAAQGHCMWAVELKAEGVLAGICGLRMGGHPGTPVPRVLEIGWRIGARWWGQGIAREAAEASLAWAWAQSNETSVAAWTGPANERSRGLMKRLGMQRRPDLDFQHPRFAADDPVGTMIVYTIDRPAT